MKSKNIGQQLLKASDGLIGTVTDLVLFFTILPFTLVGAHTTYDVDRGIEEAQKLVKDINYHAIKQSLYNMTKNGLLTRTKKRSTLEITITELGKKRIESVFPVYHTKRPWDEHMYLISYDIPRKANKIRNLLREYIRRSGGALLQESLWLSPFNPTLLLEEFISIHPIPGTVLVSKLGTDGTIGEENLETLIRRIYHLNRLSERYEEFIVKHKQKNTPKSLLSLSLDYMSILKDDPQLPFALLPKDFPGEAAYHLYKRLLQTVTNN